MLSDKDMPTTKNGNYSTTIAGQNVSEAEAQAFAEFAVRRSAEGFLRYIFTKRLRSPLGQINKQIARIERIARKAAR